MDTLEKRQGIDPERLYSLSEAAPLIPSARAGKTVTARTLKNWEKLGLITVEKRPVGQLNFWFIRGSEILRVLNAGRRPARKEKVAEAPTHRPRTKREEEEAVEEALAGLRAKGMRV